MTGTASTLSEYANTNENKRTNYRLANWFFGRHEAIYGDCILVDISECGGALLLPKKMILPHNVFDLVIQDPENEKLSSLIARAELRWSDIDYSDTHIKIGFQFKKGTSTKSRDIKQLNNYAETLDELALDCSLIF